MKKFAGILSIVMLLAMMVGMLPTGTAFAAKDPGSVVLVIHNLTGGAVNFSLTDSNGVHTMTSLPKGITEMTLAVGDYSFFAGLPCGNRSGGFHMNTGKELYLSCGKGDDVAGVNINLYNFARRTSPWYCYYVYAMKQHEDAPVGADPSVDGRRNKWDEIGSICQDYAAQVGDKALFPLPDEDNDKYLKVEFFLTGEDIHHCDAPDWGPAYYQYRHCWH